MEECNVAKAEVFFKDPWTTLDSSDFHGPFLERWSW